jgi:hypothetical protein
MVLSRISGNWRAVLNKKPDQYTDRFLNCMFGKIKVEVAK